MKNELPTYHPKLHTKPRQNFIDGSCFQHHPKWKITRTLPSHKTINELYLNVSNIKGLCNCFFKSAGLNMDSHNNFTQYLTNIDTQIGLNWIVWACVAWSYVESHIRYVQSKFGLYKRLQGTLIVTRLVVLGYSTRDDRWIPKLIAKKRKILQMLQYLTIIDQTTPKRSITYFVISYAKWPNYRMN